MSDNFRLLVSGSIEVWMKEINEVFILKLILWEIRHKPKW